MPERIKKTSTNYHGTVNFYYVKNIVFKKCRQKKLRNHLQKLLGKLHVICNFGIYAELW